MTTSVQEETLAALWTICFLICLTNDLTLGTWVFGIKAISDVIISITSAVKEVKEKLST